MNLCAARVAGVKTQKTQEMDFDFQQMGFCQVCQTDHGLINHLLAAALELLQCTASKTLKHGGKSHPSEEVREQ